MESANVNATTLQHVTKRKLEKLAEHIEKYEAKKQAILTQTEATSDLVKQVETLLEGAKKSGFDIERTGTSVKNIERYLAQAEYDPSVSQKQIREWKDMIEREIEVQGRKYKFAALFGRLCTEWLENPNNGSQLGTPRGPSDDMDIDSDAVSTSSSFVNVGRKEMQEQRDQWEEYAFNECPKDQSAIDRYLKDLFEFTKKSKKLNASPLHELQLSLGRFEDMAPKRFDRYTVEDCISGLLRADFFSGAKRRELVEMQEKGEILEEIADVLNMDLDGIESWDWEKPIPLHQRRMLNGKYRVYHDEEIHQAIFLQFLGMKWAVFMKRAFEKFFHSGAWSQHPYRALGKIDRQRRDYFLGTASATARDSVRARRRQLYESNFFMPQLPSNMGSGSEEYGDHASGAERTPTTKFQKKDLLHRLVTTEMLVQNAVYGECTVLQSDFKWFGPSIPHDTIFAVLKFLGVKGKWLDFFRRFLTAPCYWGDESVDRAPQVKQRRRGIPMSHVLSDAMGEAILFCMDFAVSKATGGADLYRFHDDLWFFGQEETVVKAWKAMQEFTAVMGLELNMEKTGCGQVFSDASKVRTLNAELPKGDVTYGLLRLDAKEKAWVVDEEKVADHVKELDRQLRACNSVFAWVQAWNSYACRFLSANLAQPAQCFGLQHVNMLLKTFSGIQTELFGPSGSAHEHLRKMVGEPDRKLVEDAMQVEDIPDAFFYFPLSIGGLEMSNPFVALLAVRDRVPKEVDKAIRQSFESDEEDWEQAKKRYEEGQHTARPTHGNAFIPAADEPFMPLEEYVRFREETSAHLAHAYGTMLEVPQWDEVESNPAVVEVVNTGYQPWSGMTPYWKWLFMLYGKEMIEQFGGVSLGEKTMLPLGMVESLKSERTRWLG